MAKKPTYSPVTDREANANEINSALDAVNEGFSNTLSLDGSTPNAMNADLDMNSNDILNTKEIDVETFKVNGVVITPDVAALDAPAVKTAYESNADTNAFTDADEAKLDQVMVQFDTVAALLADTGTYSVGTYVHVKDGYNGDGETWKIVAPGTYSTSATVLDLLGGGHQAVSTRTWFKTVAELLADTRGAAHLPAGTYLSISPYALPYEVVSTGEDVTNAGGVKLKSRASLIKPEFLNETDPTIAGEDDNLMLGGFGTWDDSAINLPTWDALVDLSPSVGDHDLERLGHFIHGSQDSVQIIGGRDGYYSYVDDDASLSITNGGDNYNAHLAGLNFGYHSLLVKDSAGTPRGSHGAVFGGSFKRVSSDYAGSFAGHIHDVHGLQSVALGGKNIKIGDLADSALVRRGGVLGGYRLDMQSGYQSVMLGGELNTIVAGSNSAIIAGDNNTIDTTEHAVIASSQHSKATADRSTVLSSNYAVGDVANAITRAAGQDTNAGDSQTHSIVVRRTMSGPSLYPSVDGGSGTELFTPPANTVGSFRLHVSVQEKQITSNNGAAYEVYARYSNIGGTLSILGQNLVTIHEDDAAWNCSAVLTGGGTRLAVLITTNGDTGTFLVQGTGEINVQTVTP